MYECVSEALAQDEAAAKFKMQPQKNGGDCQTAERCVARAFEPEDGLCPRERGGRLSGLKAWGGLVETGPAVELAAKRSRQGALRGLDFELARTRCEYKWGQRSNTVRQREDGADFAGNRREIVTLQRREPNHRTGGVNAHGQAYQVSSLKPSTPHLTGPRFRFSPT
jgi:hypothetical protein